MSHLAAIPFASMSCLIHISEIKWCFDYSSLCSMFISIALQPLLHVKVYAAINCGCGKWFILVSMVLVDVSWLITECVCLCFAGANCTFYSGPTAEWTNLLCDNLNLYINCVWNVNVKSFTCLIFFVYINFFFILLTCN